MKELFDKYKKAKKSLQYDYKSYPMENILSLEIIALIYAKKSFKLKELGYFLLTQSIKIDTKETVLFSIGSYKRSDYYEILKFVRKDIKSSLVDLSTIQKTFKFSPKSIIISFVHIFKNAHGFSITEKISLASTMTYMLNIIDDLEKNKIECVENFCSFCSNLNYEAILNYYFQKHNIPTYTLQHGLWFIYDKYPIDLVAYENLVADKLLCWGKYTKYEFSEFGIDDNKLVVSGYPRNTLKLKTKENNKIKILVLFARIQYHENNLLIIDILKELKPKTDIKIEFKLHPSLDYKIYESLAKKNSFAMADNQTIKKLMENNNYAFSIVYNSTAYYDSYMNNCISLRFRDDEADNSIDVWDDSFSNFLELEKKIEYFKIKNNDQQFWNDTEKKLEYILGYGINKYKEILNAK